LWILWVAWIISPLNWYEWMHIDLSIELIASIVLFISAFTFKKYILVRPEWILFIISYIWYIWYLVYSLD
jgi:cation:H+ antiporter